MRPCCRPKVRPCDAPARPPAAAPEPKAEPSLIIGGLQRVKSSNHDTAGTKKISNHTLELNFGLIAVSQAR